MQACNIPWVARDHLLSTNDIPPDTEVVVIRESLVKAQQKLSQLHQKIDYFVGQPSALSRHFESRENLLRQIRSQKSVLSFVRRLPAEIICEIVLLALESGEGKEAGVTLDLSRGVWPFTRVCRHWRAAITSFGALWSNISFDLDDKRILNTGPPTDGQLMRSMDNCAWLLEDCLTRSANHSLTVTINIPFRQKGFASVILDKLIAQSLRWKDVSLTLPPMPVYIDLLEGIHGSIPLLERISIKSSAGGHLSQKFCPLDILADAPRLRDVAFGEFLGLPFMKVPWSQITRYEGHAAELRQGLEILGQMSSLVDFRLIGWDADRDPEITTPPVKLPHLRRLSVDDTVILDYIVTPALEELNIECFSENALFPVIPFIRRSSCSIKALTVRGDCAMHSSLIPYGELPTLSTLSMQEAVYDSSTIITELTVDEDDTLPILPNLESLTISALVFDWRTANKAIIRMLRSRAATVGASQLALKRLRSFRFTGHVAKSDIGRAYTSRLNEIIESLREMGMDIEMDLLRFDEGESIDEEDDSRELP